MTTPFIDAQEVASRPFLMHDAEKAARLTRQLDDEATLGYQYLAAAAQMPSAENGTAWK